MIGALLTVSQSTISINKETESAPMAICESIRIVDTIYEESVSLKPRFLAGQLERSERCNSRSENLGIAFAFRHERLFLCRGQKPGTPWRFLLDEVQRERHHQTEQNCPWE